jgi:hypothetical protein
MRARDLDVPAGAGAEYGLAHGVVGIGAGSDERSARRLRRFATLPEGVYVWTRDRDGGYHLGRITGPVRDDDSANARAVGMRHVRPTDWLERDFSEAEVPAAVAKTFARGGRNFQRTHDSEAERRTGELWNAERG